MRVPWIARIVRNLLRDHGRRKRVRRTEPLHRTHDDLVLEPVDPAPSPESRATRHELQRLVWRCLAELEPAYVYSDYCLGTLWALDLDGRRNLVLLEGFSEVTAVRPGPDGELYVLERSGGVHRLTPG